MAPTATSQMDDGGASIEQCEALLQATTDEQRFVGLLLATKLMRSADDLRRIFNVALPFVRRLLATTTPLPAGDDHAPSAGHKPFRGVALSVLASFCADPDLAARPELRPCGPSAAAALVDGAATAVELQDCVSVLFALLRQPEWLVSPLHGRLLSVTVVAAAGKVADESASSEHPDAVTLACTLIERVSEAYAAIAPEAPAEVTSAVDAIAIGEELLAAAGALAPAVGTLRDALSFARLRALRALVESAAVQLEAAAADAAVATPSTGSSPAIPTSAATSAAISAFSETLGRALWLPMGSRLPPAARADGLRLAAVATRLCGPHWLLLPGQLPPAGPTAPPGRADGRAGSGGGGGSGGEGRGGLLSLILQLCSVELQMCLHDQPSDEVSDSCLAVLPACCALLEEALFRLHSDAAESSDDEGDGDGEGGGKSDGGEGGGAAAGDAWLSALNDSQLLSAQSAFVRAQMVSVEYLEALQTEEAEARKEAASKGGSKGGSKAPSGSGAGRHPLLVPVGRLVSAWIAQPSAAEMLELYDRTCAVLPLLRGAAHGEQAAWARHLRAFEPLAPSQTVDGEADDAPEAPPETRESMADLFARMMPQDPQARDKMARFVEQQKAAFPSGPSADAAGS